MALGGGLGGLGSGAFGPENRLARIGRGGLWCKEPLLKGFGAGSAWGARGSGRGGLAWGPLAWGALGAGRPTKIRERPACLDPSPASWSRNPATRGQGAPGGGAPQTLNPKPFSYAIPEPRTNVVVKRADVRWPVQDRR